MTGNMEGPSIGLTDAQMALSSNVDQKLLQEGLQFVQAEKAQTFRQAFRNHWRACFWSMFLSLALVMEGYDVVIIGSFYGQEAFLKRFGTLQSDGSYLVDANWQAGIGNSTSVGQLIGLVITGYCQERFGSKKTFITGMAFMIAFIFLMVFANSLSMLLAGEFLCGIPWGMFQTLTTAYAVEICPIGLRGFLAAFVNMCWGIGIFLSSGVARASLHIASDWGRRMPFAIQWVWPVPLLIGCFLAPESAWWLVRKGRMDDARASLIRTATPGYYDDKSLDGYLTLMHHTNELEKAESKSGSLLECFKGTNLRRTEILLGIWLTQAFGGQGITDYTVVFFEQAGFDQEKAFDLSLALNSMFIIGTILSWFLLAKFGRRPIWLVGLLTTAITLIVIGALGAGTTAIGSKYAIGAMMILVNLIYNCSIGPLCYTIAGEIPASRLRAQSIALGRSALVAVSVATGQLKPRMLSPTAFNWGAKSAFFWLGTCCLCTLWAFFRLPETRGFSFHELDILFANKVKTRQFTKVQITDESAEESGQPSTHFEDKKFDRKGEHVEIVAK